MEYLDENTLSQLISDNYSRMVISVETDYEGEATFDLVEQIHNTADKFYPSTYYLAGEGVSSYDLMDTITEDTLKVNLIAIGAVFIVLLLTMKSITLPIILVLTIETAIWINLSVPYFTGSVVFYLAYLIISSIQLGATGGLRHSVYGQIYGIPPNYAQETSPYTDHPGGYGINFNFRHCFNSRWFFA